MTRAVFIAGGHTEIGKTHVACALIRAARRARLGVAAVKPVVSGFDPADWADSDPGRLLAALGVEPGLTALDALSPWRFDAPLAPPMAAALEQRPLPLAPVVEHCRTRLAEGADLTVVEGVGGLMSPICEGTTSLDLMAALGLPSVLVSGAYLGAVSHALTALEVLRARGVPPLALVVSEDASPEAPSFEGTLALLAEHAGDTAILAARRTPDEAWADSLLALVQRS